MLSTKIKQLILASSLGLFMLAGHPEEKIINNFNHNSKTYQTKFAAIAPKSNPQESSLEKAIRENAELLTEEANHRATFKKTLNDLSQYDNYLKEASKKTGLKKNLLYAVFAAESRGNSCITSKSGAVGIAQLKEKAAMEMGLVVNEDEEIDERCDPKKAIIAGANYLKRYDLFGEDYLMLASYNWGIGNVEKLALNHGTIWKDIEPVIPKETRGYVIRVLSREKVLSKKGFDF